MATMKSFPVFISVTIIDTGLILVSSYIFSGPRMQIHMEFNGVFSKNWKQMLNSNMSANKICVQVVVDNFDTDISFANC